MTSKIILVSFLSFCVFHLHSQEQKSDNWLQEGPFGKKGRLVAPDSIWTLFEFHQNDRILSVTQEYDKDGHSADGQSVYYNPNGYISHIITIKDRKLQGPFVEFFNSGEIKQQGEFFNNFKSGRWIEFNEDGSQSSITTFNLTKQDSVLKLDPNDDRFVNFEVVFAQEPQSFLVGDEIESDVLEAKNVWKILIPEEKEIRNLNQD